MWQPAAVATPTGAAESHSYWPPPCAYTSASPSTTAIALAPAEPIGTSSASSTSARCVGDARAAACATTSMRIGPVGGGASVAAASVESTLPWAGERDGARRSASRRSTSATCTAQSVRPASPYSRVPSSGSTIHTRCRVEPRRVVLRLLGEHRVVRAVLARGRRGSGRWLWRSPSAPVPPCVRLQLEQELAGTARDVGRERVVVHCRRARPSGRARGSSSCFAARRNTPASTGFTSITSTSARPAEELVGVAVEQQQDRRVRAAARPTPRGAGRSRRRRRPCCRSGGRARRGRARARATAPRTSWPRVTSTTCWPGPTNAARTWSRTHFASAATRIVVIGRGASSSARRTGVPADLVRARRSRRRRGRGTARRRSLADPIRSRSPSRCSRSSSAISRKSARLS